VAVAVGESLARTQFGRWLAVGGATTVALDDEGGIVEYRPDGSRDLPGTVTRREVGETQDGNDVLAGIACCERRYVLTVH